MKKFTLIACCLLVLASCRREQALFQKSQTTSYQPVAKQQVRQGAIMASNQESLLPVSAEVKNTFEELSVPVVLPVEKIVFEEKRSNVPKRRSFVKAIQFRNKVANKIDNFGHQKVFKAERRKEGFFENLNSKVKIGIVFLLLAILFSLINFKLLAIIFAIAAIIFIARGLRRAF